MADKNVKNVVVKEVKVNPDVEAIVKFVSEAGRPVCYKEVCEALGKKFGTSLFTKAVKDGRLVANEVVYDCAVVRADGFVMGSKKVKVNAYEPAK